jgi:polyhydroxyalkanoate synthesis repressor PhaR
MKRKSTFSKSRGDKTKPKRVIKKYSDRRLYDSSASRYVKLEDVARMVRDGVDVKVVDARSGKDLTYVTFTQIILEDAREREAPLPLQLLQQLVRASDKATHEFLSWYLNSTLDLYQKAQDTLRTRYPEAKTILARPVEFVRGLLAEHAWPPAPPAPSAPEREEVERLRRRVEELEAKRARRPRKAVSSRQKAVGRKQ